MQQRPNVPSWPETAVRAGLSAVPLVGGPLSVLFEDISSRRRGRYNEFATKVDEHLGGALREMAESNEQADDLLMEGAIAYARSNYEEKKQLLTRVAANAVADPALIDKGRQIVFTLDQLEAEHVTALTRMAHHDVRSDPLLQRGPRQPVWSRVTNWTGYRQDDLEAEYGAVLVAQLVEAGVIGQTSEPRLHRQMGERVDRLGRGRTSNFSPLQIAYGLPAVVAGILREMTSRAFGLRILHVTDWGRQTLSELAIDGGRVDHS